MNEKKIIPVIICGGSGTRLWPLSRESFPKQYLKINKEENYSFLQKTLLRVNNKNLFEDPIIICNEEHRFIVAEQLREINIISKYIILEPFGKNTAPAITIAAIKSLEIILDPCILVLPADHLVDTIELFQKAIESRIITFGINPTRPETGYGYIESKNFLDHKKLNGETIENFIEKPNLEKAKELILNKKFTWNSGMFLFKSKTLIEEIKLYAPELYSNCEKSISDNLVDLDFQRLNREIFSKCKNISFDKAIMEKTKLGMVIALDVGWTDIGNWNSVWEISSKNENKNVISGNVVTRDVINSYIRSDNRMIVCIGLKNLIVVEADDALLIAEKNKVQEIKNVVEELIKKNKPEAKNNKKVFRPWGNYTSIGEYKT